MFVRQTDIPLRSTIVKKSKDGFLRSVVRTRFLIILSSRQCITLFVFSTIASGHINGLQPRSFCRAYTHTELSFAAKVMISLSPYL